MLVTCDLIPLAVLKRLWFYYLDYLFLVTCDLIPLAVLKRCERYVGEEKHFVVTCDLIPLAVLKPLLSLLIPPRK